MAGIEMIIGVAVGTGVLICSIMIISAIISIANGKDIKKIKNIYIRRLSNSDASIHDAVKYLKLTNSIMDYTSGDK